MVSKKSKNCVFLKHKGKEIYILGTAHVLEESKKEVLELMDKINPETVCVELCPSRYQSLKKKNRWKNLDIVKVIKEGKGFLLFTNMILFAFQKRIGLSLDFSPGQEMITAIKLAEKNKKNIVLADRDINITLKRAWILSSFKDKIKILEVLLESLFSSKDDNLQKKDILELMKGQDLYNEALSLFAKSLPEVKRVFIDERDAFLAKKISEAPGKKILAVVGKGHQKGILKQIKKRLPYIDSIETLPKEGKLKKLLPWIITLILIGILVPGFMKGETVGLSMLAIWALVTGSITALSNLIVLAHPLTIISSWIVAPIALLIPIPFVSTGVFLPLIEASIRKPCVKDFESLPEDLLSLKGFYKNRITRILMVLVASSFGSIIGFLISTFIVVPWVGSITGR